MSADADVRGFYAALGVELPGWVHTKAPVRCFADPDAHAHQDRDASCSVNLHSGAFHCHGCGAKGGAFDAALLRGLDSRRAFDLKVAYGLAERRPPRRDTSRSTSPTPTRDMSRGPAARPSRESGSATHRGPYGAGEPPRRQTPSPADAQTSARERASSLAVTLEDVRRWWASGAWLAASRARGGAVNARLWGGGSRGG
jgi:hypothetical protein